MLPLTTSASIRHDRALETIDDTTNELLSSPLPTCYVQDNSDSEGLWTFLCPNDSNAILICRPSGTQTSCQGIVTDKAISTVGLPTADQFLAAYWDLDTQTVQQLLISIGVLQADPTADVTDSAFALLHSLRGGELLQRITQQAASLEPDTLRRLTCTLWLIFPKAMRHEQGAAQRLHLQGVLCGRALWQPDTLAFRLRQLAQTNSSIARVGLTFLTAGTEKFDRDDFVCPTSDICLRPFFPQSPPWNLAIVTPDACVEDILAAHVSQTIGHSNPEKLAQQPDPVQNICAIPSLSRLLPKPDRYKSIAQQNVVWYQQLQQGASPTFANQAIWRFLQEPVNATSFPRFAVQLPFAITKANFWQQNTLKQALIDFPSQQTSSDFQQTLQNAAIAVAWSLGLSDSEQRVDYSKDCTQYPVHEPLPANAPDCLWPFDPLPDTIHLAPAPAPALCDEECEIEIILNLAPAPR